VNYRRVDKSVEGHDLGYRTCCLTVTDSWGGGYSLLTSVLSARACSAVYSRPKWHTCMIEGYLSQCTLAITVRSCLVAQGLRIDTVRSS